MALLKTYRPAPNEHNPCPPKRVRNLLQRGIELRNRVVHEGDGSPSPSNLQTLFVAIEDTMWLLEWCNGFPRAWSFISGDTQHEYIIDYHQRVVRESKLPEEEMHELKTAIPSLLRVDENTDQAVATLVDLMPSLRRAWLEELKKNMPDSVIKRAWPDYVVGEPRRLGFRVELPPAPLIG